MTACETESDVGGTAPLPMPARHALGATAVGVALFLLYIVPWRGPGWVPAAYTSRDSLGNRLLAASLASRASTDLSPWFAGEIPALLREQVLVELSTADGSRRLAPRFPAGTGLLAVPFFVGVPRDAASHRFDRMSALDTLMVREHLAAALMTALAGALFFALVRGGGAGGASLHEALLLTAAFAVASPVWSSNAQGLWPQTGSTLAVVAMAVLLVGGWRAAPTRAAWLFAGAGVAAGVAAWCRPTHLVTCAVVAVALAAMRGGGDGKNEKNGSHGGDEAGRDSADADRAPRRVMRRALPFAAGAGAVLAAMAAFHLAVYGTLTGPYFADVFDLWRRGDRMERHFFKALAGTLLSPACGLLLYCPFVLLVVGSDAWRWRGTPLARLALLLAAAHTLILWRHPVWWGGWSWGPRLFVDALPWIVLLCLPLARALRERRRAYLPWLLVAIGVGAAWLGVARFDHGWFFRHPDLPTERAPLWSLRDSPLLDALRRGRPLTPPQAGEEVDWSVTRIPTPPILADLSQGAPSLRTIVLNTGEERELWTQGAGYVPTGPTALTLAPGVELTTALQYQDRLYVPMPPGELIADAPVIVVAGFPGRSGFPPFVRPIAGFASVEGGGRAHAQGPGDGGLIFFRARLDPNAPFLVLEHPRPPAVFDPLATLPPVELITLPALCVLDDSSP